MREEIASWNKRSSSVEAQTVLADEYVQQNFCFFDALDPVDALDSSRRKYAIPHLDDESPRAPRTRRSSRSRSRIGFHASDFRDCLLKPELLRVIIDCGFEQPSEGQHEAIPQASLGTDVICQANLAWAGPRSL